MGDPSVVVGYWDLHLGRYVDDDGAQVSLPMSSAAASVTYVQDDGAPLAVLVHDPAVRDPDLLAAVSAAVRLAVSNVRLRSEIRDRAARLSASRRRIVEAGDRQRRELETELSAGTLDRLDEVARLLDGVRIEGAEAIRIELRETRAELMDFANGVRPVALTAGGLASALPLLVARSPVQVALTVRLNRIPASVEACLYFVCAEALTNVVKHASATHVEIDVGLDGDSFQISIVDDGAGGADPASGTGLHGLADRVEALGGALTVSSGPETGTSVTARIPRLYETDLVRRGKPWPAEGTVD